VIRATARAAVLRPVPGSPVILGAVRATVAAPATLPLSLAAFLIRGGIVVLAIPMLVLPTPVGIGNLAGPSLLQLATGTIPLAVVEAAIAAGLILVAWVVVGGWAAAILEAETVRLVVEAGEGRAPEADRRPSRGREAGRILAVRLVAAVPLVVVLAVGSVRVTLATYRELTDPVAVGSSLVIRVLRDVPEVVLAVLVAFALAEILGAVAARHVVIRGSTATSAFRDAARDVVRQPISTLVHWVVPAGVGVVVLAAAVVATAWAWATVRGVLGADGLARELAAVAILVACWTLGLVAVAAASAWRGTVWTRAAMLDRGTFGVPTDRHPGDWRTDPTSPTL